jgi:hypothetical protein
MHECSNSDRQKSLTRVQGTGHSNSKECNLNQLQQCIMQGRGNGGRGHRGARGGGGGSGLRFWIAYYVGKIFILITCTGGRGRGSSEYSGTFPNFLSSTIDPSQLTAYNPSLVSDSLNRSQT